MLLNIEFPLFNLLEKFRLFPRRSTTRAAFALIAIDHEGERQYLLQWNPKWHCYNFIGGKVQVDEDGENEFEGAIRREIKEEMGVDLERVMVEQEIKQIRLWQFSEREKRMKPYHFSIFAIQFFPDLPVDRQTVTRSLRWLSSKQENAYVSQREISGLQTDSGKPVSKTVRRILVELGEISV
ncbi:MAG: NUDIX domain-containing protein [Anaerolineae bacterium]|nr:NUDIX domain-containing protein [Anaerolineae bacterium]